VDGSLAVWIERWLSNRKQRVVLNGVVSDWMDVESGVPQGSVLGPLLFTVFINDIDQSVISSLLKFADDAKLFRVIYSSDDVESLRTDLGKLFEWSKEWLMLFNVEKCKVMHLGRNNDRCSYSLDGKILSEVLEEKDLGVIIQEDLKVSKQCSKAASTANRVLGMIKRTFVLRSKEVILPLYKSLVRPHLETCIQAWRPYLKKDINVLEAVQRRATKMICGLSRLEYEERLQILNITSLELRRLRGDLIEVFKILNGFDIVDKENFFCLSSTNLRGHSLKLYKGSFNTNMAKFSFKNRVIDDWNNLPEDVVYCNTVNSFKNKLDDYLRYSRGFL
jgi:hypothetical protein